MRYRPKSTQRLKALQRGRGSGKNLPKKCYVIVEHPLLKWSLMSLFYISDVGQVMTYQCAASRRSWWLSSLHHV